MSEAREDEVLADRLEQARAYLHIDDKRKELEKLDEESSEAGFWDDPTHAPEVSKRASSVRETLQDFAHACSLLEDARTAFDLAQEDPEFEQEAHAALDELSAMIDRFEIESWFSGKYDEGPAIVAINPGSGGLEAQDWVEMLYRMYVGYAESKGWKVKVLDYVSDVIGLERVSFEVEGRFAYGMLRSELGVHRLVRISPTDLKKRRHTTFASVEVMPVLSEDIEVNLNPADVRVDVYRSSGPGGQCVNTTDSAVRLTHIPTGIVVTCQNEKSQLLNKDSAFRVLRARLYELEQAKRKEQLDELRGEKIDSSFGSQIRNYVLYPYQLVKDVRSGVETGNVEAVLGGEIEEFVIGYHRWRVSQ